MCLRSCGEARITGFDETAANLLECDPLSPGGGGCVSLMWWCVIEEEDDNERK
jgi:hypothetical protein